MRTINFVLVKNIYESFSVALLARIGYCQGLIIKDSRVRIPTGAPTFRTTSPLLSVFIATLVISYSIKNSTSMDSRILKINKINPITALKTNIGVAEKVGVHQTTEYKIVKLFAKNMCEKIF